MDTYILDANDLPVRATMMDSFKWKEKFGRHVGKDKIGDVGISTVFLGMDHGYGGGPPVLWETMIFGGINDQYQERYISKKSAIEGHKRAVEAVKRGVNLHD